MRTGTTVLPERGVVGVSERDELECRRRKMLQTIAGSSAKTGRLGDDGTSGPCRVARRRAWAWIKSRARGSGTNKETPIRSLRTSVAALLLFAIAPAFVSAQSATTVRDLLELRPILKGVEYEIPTDASAIDACKTETVYNAQKKAIGVVLRDGQGKLLRRFVDADGN